MARAVRFPGKDLKRENPASGEPSTGQTRCWRCKGLMIVESRFDLAGDAGQLDGPARRCVQCGEVIDPVILQNRRLQLEQSLARARS